MGIKKDQALLAAAVACFLAAVGSVSISKQVQAEGEGKVPCYGINKCKGAGECGGKVHSCAGQNECAGQGSIMLDKDTCLKIQGGRLTAEEGSN